MFIIRDIFNLRFGEYKNAKVLIDDAFSRGLLPEAKSSRILSDFTGDSYRLIFEEGYDSLGQYESSLEQSIGKSDWKKWYEKFKVHVASSHREILKVVQ